MVEQAARVTLGKVEGWSRLARTLAANLTKEQLRAILLPNGVPAAVPQLQSAAAASAAASAAATAAGSGGPAASGTAPAAAAATTGPTAASAAGDMFGVLGTSPAALAAAALPPLAASTLLFRRHSVRLSRSGGQFGSSTRFTRSNSSTRALSKVSPAGSYRPCAAASSSSASEDSNPSAARQTPT